VGNLPHKENIIHIIGHIVYVALYGLLIISSIYLYNSAGLIVLLYIGWVVLILGVAILLTSVLSRRKGRISENGVSRETLVESGMYAFVRHPEFLGHILIISSLILLAQHFISLAIGALLILLLYLAMIEEEKRNIEKFGDAYRDYMRRVPRINLLVGIIKQMCSKKKERLKSEQGNMQ